MEDTQNSKDEPTQEHLENEPLKQQETRDEMLSRHRKEATQLQNKEIEMKKAAARGSKAEQKAKKKQVEEEMAKLSAKLKEKHTEELSSLGYTSTNTSGNGNGNLDTLVKAIAGVSMTNQADNYKLSKSVKRREKRAQQEAAREQRIKEEQSNVVSDRVVENDNLEKKLQPLGLTINEVKPDGHCLYRAVEDQLAWGGQLELGALTNCLKKHIMIFSGSFPDVEMGKEYKSGDGAAPLNSSIMLSYHRHAFGLGEHYNSVIPNSPR